MKGKAEYVAKTKILDSMQAELDEEEEITSEASEDSEDPEDETDVEQGKVEE